MSHPKRKIVLPLENSVLSHILKNALVSPNCQQYHGTLQAMKVAIESIDWASFYSVEVRKKIFNIHSNRLLHLLHELGCMPIGFITCLINKFWIFAVYCQGGFRIVES